MKQSAENFNPRCRCAVRFDRDVAGLADHFESVATPNDMARIEMPAEHQRRRVSKPRENPPACRDRRGLVVVEVTGPFNSLHLAGIVRNVGNQNCLFAIRPDQNAHVSDAMARR